MIPITTFDELTGLIAGFGDGHLGTLVICSEGGMGKSEEVDRVLNGQDALRIVGHLTPLKLYELAYRSCDKPIVFHEIDCLLANPQHVGLLKQLCETRALNRSSAGRRSVSFASCGHRPIREPPRSTVGGGTSRRGATC